MDVDEESTHSNSELEDDDYDLIEENLGVKFQRKKFKRLRRISDDSDEGGAQGQGDDRDAIAHQLFEGSDNEEPEEDRRVDHGEATGNRDHYSSDSDEYSDTDDFIVDEEGLPIKESRRQRRHVSNVVVQEAQDIFGVDFDYNEFERFGDQEVGSIIPEDDDDDDESEQQESLRTKRQKPRKSIFEIYEPYELERAGFTEIDAKVRSEDIPERLLTRSIPVLHADEEDLQEEANWVFKNANFTGISRNMRAFAVPAQSEANWGEDWDTRTVIPGGAATVIETAIPPAPATNAGWADEDDWDKGTTVGAPDFVDWKRPAAATVIKTAIPPPPATNTDWADEWDKGSTVGAPDFVDWKRPTAATATATVIETAIPPAPASNADWADEVEWDKGTTVGDPDFVNWKRPAAATATVIETAIPPAPATNADWANEEEWGGRQSNIPAVPTIMIPSHTPDDESETKTTQKIRNSLRYIKNQYFEVPFIAFYRKEYVMPELSLNDLWKIYRMDARFCEMKMKRDRLSKLFCRMQEYLVERCIQLEAADAEIDNTRVISDEHLERVKEIKTVEELKDMQLYFQVHYKECVADMRSYFELKETERQLREGDHGTDLSADKNTTAGKMSVYKIKRRAGAGGNYAKCLRSNPLLEFLEKIGITSEKFAENVRDKYQRHPVEQWPVSPTDVASEISTRLTLRSSPDAVVKAAGFILSVQIANEPIVRKCVRKEFFERATVNCSPTIRGQRDIDECHPCYTMKYLKEKPVKSFKEDQFLKLTLAETDGLVNLSLGETFTYYDEIKYLITRDEYSKTVQEWNEVREECLRLAMQRYVIPSLQKELRAKLIEDCYEYILERCSNKLHHWLKVAPMKICYQDEDEIEWDTSQGIRVLSIAYDLQFNNTGAMAALLRPDGELDVRSFRHDQEPTDRLHLKNLLRRKDEEKEEDLRLLKDFIRDLKPHVIVIAGESREAMRIKQDVSQIVTELVTDDAFPEIKIEIVDNEAAKVYASSKRSYNDLGKDCSTLFRQAVSLGRRVQDPLLEFAQLWNMDEDILCIKFHPLQGQIPKERLLERLEIEFINRTCEVGVDINRALNYPHTASVVQFTCGLGPRKASAVMQILRQNHGSRLENRSQLLTSACMGAKVFLNCAGFIKIDTSTFEDSTESYVEILDGTRVHPESYEYAKRMAVDALYDADETDYNEALAVEEIMEDPDPVKLDALHLDQFAETLKSQGSGDKLDTLFDIREELKGKYKDMRSDYTSPDPDELFNILTKETPETFYVGKLVTATVIDVFRTKPKEEDEQVEPTKINSGKWQCSLCGMRDFPELTDVWNHLDTKLCPGPAIGVRLHLENGLSGFIPTTKLSDKPVNNPEDRVFPGQQVHCRITKIMVDRFSVECTSRTSDLLDLRDEWKPKKDAEYDKDRETYDLDKMKEVEERKKSRQNRQVYVKRVIVHPSFRNVSFKEAETLLQSMDQGDVIVRPSSKGASHLTVTWKVAEGIAQHIDVREEGKASVISLGQSLWINEDEFEDIDEIIARHVTPMAAHARDIINYRYFITDLGGEHEKAEEYLLQQQQKNSNKIHYVLQASKEFPGKFMLSYLPRNSALHEFVTVTPDGFRFRQQIFDSLNDLLGWFKKNYKAFPANTPLSSLNYGAT